jgi:DNA helicase HerA-like ATPase
MDGSSACGFFDMILGLFVEADIGGAGKLVVLDEAHKVSLPHTGTTLYLQSVQYLSDKGTSSRLTDSLLTVIRQQRHLATRVVISTQEPTVVPEKFLDLCSFVIAHRFSSPTWLKHLTQHMSTSDTSFDDLWTKVNQFICGYPRRPY